MATIIQRRKWNCIETPREAENKAVQKPRGVVKEVRCVGKHGSEIKALAQSRVRRRRFVDAHPPQSPLTLKFPKRE